SGNTPLPLGVVATGQASRSTTVRSKAGASPPRRPLPASTSGRCAPRSSVANSSSIAGSTLWVGGSAPLLRGRARRGRGVASGGGGRGGGGGVGRGVWPRQLRGELGDVARHLDDVEPVRRAVLEDALAVGWPCDLADQDQHRQAVAPRRCHAGHRVE